MSIDPGEFRRAMSRYPSGVVVVTTVVDGFDHAMTANSFTSVSLDPPLVLVCVERSTRFHEAVLAADQWAVSVLDRDHADAARWFAHKGRPLEGQMEKAPFHRGANGVPLIDGALATFEVTTTQVSPAGDHDIVVGEVTSLQVGDSDSPLIFFERTLRGL